MNDHTPPPWEVLEGQYKQMLSETGITESEIAAWFGYKDRRSFKQSRAYKSMVFGIMSLVGRVKF